MDLANDSSSAGRSARTPAMFRRGEFGELKLLFVESCSGDLLEALTTVSQDLRRIALVRKYETVVIDEGNMLLYLDEDNLGRVSQYMCVREQHFVNTRRVVIRVYPRPARFLCHELELVKVGLVAVVNKIARQASEPVEIIWDHCNLYGTKLHKNLTVRPKDTVAITGNIYRTNWTGLAKLRIFNLPLQQGSKAVAVLRNDLVTLLLASPGLKKLGLGVKRDDFTVWYKKTGRNGKATTAMPEMLGCFQSIANDFHIKGGRQLKLKSLELGIGMILLAPNGLNTTLSIDERRAAPKHASDFYLWKLLAGPDLQYLKLDTSLKADIRFASYPGNFGDCYYELPPPRDLVQGALAWFCISTEYLPNLVRLDITERTRRFDEFMFVEGNEKYLQGLQLVPGRARDFCGKRERCGPGIGEREQPRFLHHFSYFQDAHSNPRGQLCEEDFNKLQPSQLLLPGGVDSAQDVSMLTGCGWLKTVGVKLLPHSLHWYGKASFRDSLVELGTCPGITELWIMNGAGLSREARLTEAECQKLHTKIFNVDAVESGRSTTGGMTMMSELRCEGLNRQHWFRKGDQLKLTSQSEATVRASKPSERHFTGLVYTQADLWYRIACCVAHGATDPKSSLQYLKVGADAWRIHRVRVDGGWEPDPDDYFRPAPPSFTVRMEKLTLHEQHEQGPNLFSHEYDVALADEAYRAHPKYMDGWFEQNEDKLQFGWK